MKVALIGTVASSLLGFRKELITDLLDSGHRVFAFAIDYDDESFKAVEKLGAIPVKYSMSRAGANPVQDLWCSFKLYKQLQELSPDRVLTFFVKPVIFASLAARLAGVPVVVGMLEGLGIAFTQQPGRTPARTRAIKRVQLFLYKLVLPWLDRVIFLNQDDANELMCQHGIRLKNTYMLGPIGLNLNHFRFAPPKRSPVTFIFIGRLLREKGIFEYTQAAKLVRLKHPKTIFKAVGDIDSTNPGSIQPHDIGRFKSEGNVEFIGYSDDVRSHIAESSVFVLPSYREGFPRSTQEAMAMGRPVITTDVPGCRQSVLDGINGFIIPPWDEKALAARMTYFIEHPDQIIAMGRRSHAIAQRTFDATTVNRKILKTLKL